MSPAQGTAGCRIAEITYATHDHGATVVCLCSVVLIATSDEEVAHLFRRHRMGIRISTGVARSWERSHQGQVKADPTRGKPGERFEW